MVWVVMPSMHAGLVRLHCATHPRPVLAVWNEMKILPDSWSELFILETPLLELVARGTLLYTGILVLFRFMPRRSGGEMALMDLIFALLIVSAVSHSLGNYTSIADGLFLVLVTMGWNYVLNALSFRIPLVEKLLSPSALPVVKDGKLLLRNMRREFLTREELHTCLREHGVEDLADVKIARIEGDGSISVIKHSDRRRS